MFSQCKTFSTKRLVHLAMRVKRESIEYEYTVHIIFLKLCFLLYNVIGFIIIQKCIFIYLHLICCGGAKSLGNRLEANKSKSVAIASEVKNGFVQTPFRTFYFLALDSIRHVDRSPGYHTPMIHTNRRLFLKDQKKYFFSCTNNYNK